MYTSLRQNVPSFLLEFVRKSSANDSTPFTSPTKQSLPTDPNKTQATTSTVSRNTNITNQSPF